MTSSVKRGGKRLGSGRKKGTPNKSTFELKQAAAEYGEEALGALISIIRNKETPPNVVVSACREVLDRGFGKPAVSVEVEADVRLIPWDELRQISEKSLAIAEEKHKNMIEGRAERLDLKIEYASDAIELD
jgi:hypothetical protein